MGLKAPLVETPGIQVEKKSRERLQGPASIGNISRHQGFKDPTLLPSLGWDLSPWDLSPQRGGEG